MGRPTRTADGREKVSQAVKRAARTVWPHGMFTLRVATRNILAAGHPVPERTRIARVIFACRHNAGRSQMAATFFNQMVDPGRARGIAAGTGVVRAVAPHVREAMREAGIDLEDSFARRLNAHLAMAGGTVVTMGCLDDLPFLPGVAVEDWEIEDPRDQPPDRVREIRDEIRRRVEELVDHRGWRRSVVPG
jgi:arsenate reductase